jgi:hypothetical protein
MKVKTYHNYLDYINSDENNWSYVRLEDFENAGDKQVKVYLDKDENEVDIKLINKKKGNKNEHTRV